MRAAEGGCDMWLRTGYEKRCVEVGVYRSVGVCRGYQVCLRFGERGGRGRGAFLGKLFEVCVGSHQPSLLPC